CLYGTEPERAIETIRESDFFTPLHKETETMTTLPATQTISERYPILSRSPEQCRALIETNLGNGALSPFHLDRIRIPTGGGTSWVVPSLEGEREAREFEGIILNWREPRAYWQHNFDESGGGTPPDCSSNDGILGTGTPGGSCEVCPLAQWGSAPRQERGQACKQMRLLFVLLPGNILPVLVQLPPTSIVPARKYFMRLTSAEIYYHSVITKFTIERTKNKQGIAYAETKLSLAGRLAPEQAAAVQELIKAMATSLERARPVYDEPMQYESNEHMAF
ncbi:MAG: hypothetical protein ACREJC_20250, partial [Tepidisphaeraceae bacterium]